MSKIRLTGVVVPPTPPPGKVYLYIDPADKRFKQKDDTGAVKDLTLGDGALLSASNQGGGIGLFEAVNGTDLEFRSLISPSGKVVIALNAGNKEVELGVNLAASDVGLGNVTNDAQLNRAGNDFAAFPEKTAPVIADLILFEDSEASNAKKKVQLGNILPVFGRESAYQESLTVTTITSSAAYVNKVTLDVQAELGAALQGGTYRVGWGYQWNYDATNSDFLARLQLDGADLPTFAWNHQEEPQDAGGNDPPGTQSAQRLSENAQRRLVFAPGDTPVFTLDFQPQAGGVEASMWNAYIEFWRVA